MEFEGGHESRLTEYGCVLGVAHESEECESVF